MKLSEIECEQLRVLIANRDIKSSDRVRDRARTRLKKLGYIYFDRAAWLWRITDAGRAALEGGEK